MNEIIIELYINNDRAQSINNPFFQFPFRYWIWILSMHPKSQSLMHLLKVLNFQDIEQGSFRLLPKVSLTCLKVESKLIL